jgi:hypothetical protein
LLQLRGARSDAYPLWYVSDEQRRRWTKVFQT